MLRYLFIALFVVSCFATGAIAQRSHKVNFDTVTLARLQAGEPVRDIEVKVIEPIDTILWGGQDGASLLRFAGAVYGFKGEFRIATLGSYIHQISFTLTTKDSATAASDFEALDALIEKHYGNPNEGYTNVYKMIRWNGKKQYLALQTKDGSNYVSIVLSEIDKLKPH